MKITVSRSVGVGCLAISLVAISLPTPAGAAPDCVTLACRKIALDPDENGISKRCELGEILVQGNKVWQGGAYKIEVTADTYGDTFVGGSAATQVKTDKWPVRGDPDCPKQKISTGKVTVFLPGGQIKGVLVYTTCTGSK